MDKNSKNGISIKLDKENLFASIGFSIDCKYLARKIDITNENKTTM